MQKTTTKPTTTFSAVYMRTCQLAVLAVRDVGLSKGLYTRKGWTDGDSHCLLPQRLCPDFSSSNVRAWSQRHVQNAGIQLHSSHDTVALVGRGIGDAAESTNANEKGTLSPATVEDERSTAEGVEEDHGHHRCDDRGGVIDDLPFC